jgi:hypothetical protein
LEFLNGQAIERAPLNSPKLGTIFECDPLGVIWIETERSDLDNIGGNDDLGGPSKIADDSLAIVVDEEWAVNGDSMQITSQGIRTIESDPRYRTTQDPSAVKRSS